MVEGRAERSALLPTPRAAEAEHSGRSVPAKPGQQQGLTETVNTLLPTPRASDGPNGGPGQRGSSGDLMLPSAVAQLLPTPQTFDRFPWEGQTPEERGTKQQMLGHVVRGLTDAANAEDVKLLPTPAVNDMGDGKTLEWWDEWAPRQKDRHGKPAPHGSSLAIEAQRMLPTPSASDGAGGKTSRSGDRKDEALLGGIAKMLPTPVADPDSANGHARDLGGEARLLPTPTSTDHKASGSSQDRTETHAQGTTLTDAAVRQVEKWGDYAPAITRWEAAIGRPAPDATTPTGKNGGPQLSPRFVEWMMGLPEGWVTEVAGLSRAEMLKALGNGVVRQQAAYAVNLILETY